jgi:DNA-binding GntR family transcriptional regulator
LQSIAQIEKFPRNMPKANKIKSQSPASPNHNSESASIKPPNSPEGIAIEEQKTARDRIRWTLLKRISEGLYRPGERLKEMKLAQEFEVSQAPVREVFRELETLGLLVSRRYHGTHVREISSQENRDTYQLRGYLEEIAVQLIPPAKLEETIQSLEALQASMRTYAAAGDPDAFAQANTQFHRTIISASSNKTLLKVWDSLEIGMLSRLNLQKNEEKLASLGEIHQPIVDSFKQGDLKQTGFLLREHAFSFLKDLP